MQQRPEPTILPHESTQQPVFVAQSYQSERQMIFQPTDATYQFMQALCFIARADGKLMQAECLEISVYLREAQPEHIKAYDRFLEDRIRGLEIMPVRDYRQYLDSLDRKSLVSFLGWTKRLVAQQTKLPPFAEYLLEELESKCNSVIEDEFEIVDGVRQYVIS